MPLKILFVSATSIEADVINRINGIIPVGKGFSVGSHVINLLVTGIGSANTSWSIENWIHLYGRPDLAINIGIAGSYNNKYKIGDVVIPVDDCFADLGIENGDDFFTLAEAGLADVDEFPYCDGYISANNRFVNEFVKILPPVRAITVNTATGSEISRKMLIKKFNPDIETMEGATFFYICSMEKIPFFALRAVSNKVEVRDKSNWNIKIALDNLSEKLNEIFKILD